MLTTKRTTRRFLAILFCVSLLVGCSTNFSSQSNNGHVNSVSSIFDGDCGISASAEIGNNIINFPELKITVTNTTDKQISAIKFYALPQDV